MVDVPIAQGSPTNQPTVATAPIANAQTTIHNTNPTSNTPIKTVKKLNVSRIELRDVLCVNPLFCVQLYEHHE